jgi:hypothetical protein
MKNLRIILTILYIIICSITVLVMLTTSFELFNEKYFPSFMLAQKYALPIILTAMTVAYLTFFEPDYLLNKRIMLFVRIGFVLSLGIFAFFLFTLDAATASGITVVIYWIQLSATTLMTNDLFKKQG